MKKKSPANKKNNNRPNTDNKDQASHTHTKDILLPGESNIVHQLGRLAGLKGKEWEAFTETYNNYTGPLESFAEQLQNHPRLTQGKQMDQLQALFHLTSLTGHDLLLVEKLVKAKKIHAV